MDFLTRYESEDEETFETKKPPRKRKRISSAKSQAPNPTPLSLTPPRLSSETDRYLSHIYLPVIFGKCTSNTLLKFFWREQEWFCERKDQNTDALPLDSSPSCVTCESRWKGESAQQEREIIFTNQLHVSVSKSFFLERSQIKPFVGTLETFLAVCPPFSLAFDDFGWFQNESKEKNFFAFISKKPHLETKKILASVDGVLERFMKECYYPDPQVQQGSIFFVFFYSSI
jgi:hypothetical protein